MHYGPSATMGFYAVHLSHQKTKKKDFWTAQHPDLRGCHVVREDAQRALDDLGVAREEWIARAKGRGETIPSPATDLLYTIVFDADHTPSDAEKARAAVNTAAQEIPTVHV